jgi:glycosyltransferase involved in cell wall biosynthesis
MSNKSISVVFVTLNNPKALRDTYLSIKIATNIVKEIIVVDSSDNDEIKIFCNREISKHFNLKYLHEEPQGIYHAMNTGLNVIEDNSYVWYLNPGDLLIDIHILEQLLKAIQDNNLVWGYAQAQKSIKDSIEIFPKENLITSSKNIASGNLAISHQSMLTRAVEIRNLGGFEEKYSIAADLKFQILLSQKFKSINILSPLVKIDPSGISHNQILATFLQTFVIRFWTKDFSKVSTFLLAAKFIELKLRIKILNKLMVIK